MNKVQHHERILIKIRSYRPMFKRKSNRWSVLSTGINKISNAIANGSIFGNNSNIRTYYVESCYCFLFRGKNSQENYKKNIPSKHRLRHRVYAVQSISTRRPQRAEYYCTPKNNSKTWNQIFPSEVSFSRKSRSKEESSASRRQPYWTRPVRSWQVRT